MVLGLGRLLLMTVIGTVAAYRRNPDKIVPWKELINKTFAWLIPVNRLWRKRPLYSTFSFLFHVGLIIVPLFLAAHVMLWHRSVGFGWFKLPQTLADRMTLLVIVTGAMLIIGRVFNRNARFLSRWQDFIWPPLLMVPFVTGYACANLEVGPGAYRLLMLIHVFSGDLIIVMIPFTKIAHCVLMPLSQLVTGIGWKFPAGAGDRVIETLGYGGRPTWVDKPRLGGKPAPVEGEG